MGFRGFSRGKTRNTVYDTLKSSIWIRQAKRLNFLSVQLRTGTKAEQKKSKKKGRWGGGKASEIKLDA